MDYTKELLKAVAYKGLSLTGLYIAAFLYTIANFVGRINAGAYNE